MKDLRKCINPKCGREHRAYKHIPTGAEKKRICYSLKNFFDRSEGFCECDEFIPEENEQKRPYAKRSYDADF